MKTCFSQLCLQNHLMIHYFPSCRKLDSQKEFEDFTDESRQLEQELETTLIQNEKQIRDLNGMIISLRDDNEALRVGFFFLKIVTLEHLFIKSVDKHFSKDSHRMNVMPTSTRPN